MASAAQAPPSRCAVVSANRLCNNGRQEPAGRRQRVVHGAQSAGTRLVEPHRRGAAAALRNHALWIKMRILFYRLDGVDNGALFQTAATPAPSPEGGAAAPVTSETFLMWHYVENADFENMAMTRTGTVVFPSHTGAWVTTASALAYIMIMHRCVALECAHSAVTPQQRTNWHPLADLDKPWTVQMSH